MMRTRKLYLNDAYTTTFQAQFLTCQRDSEGRPVAVLDQTYFYPESGGQPSDRGSIGGIDIVDIQEDDSGAVLHVLAAEPGPGLVGAGTNGHDDGRQAGGGVDDDGQAGGGVDDDGRSDDLERHVDCTVDWTRRFDHMQQHTGQHVLSRAFIEVAGLETVSFHLGEESCTIDLEGGKLTDDVSRAAEELANSIILENREVRVITGAPEDFDTGSFRKSPPDGVTEVRLVEIDGFDTNPCCGTHVRSTGELGMIKITRFEKAKGAFRVHFEVGKRAYGDFVKKHEIVKRLAGSFTTAVENVEEAVEKLRSDGRRFKKESKNLAKQLAAYEAEELRDSGQQIGGLIYVVGCVAGKSEDYVRLLANSLKTKENVVSLLGVEEGMVVCNAPADSGIDFSAAVIERAKSLGGSGGGKGGFATARLPASVPVEEFLNQVFEDVKNV